MELRFTISPFTRIGLFLFYFVFTGITTSIYAQKQMEHLNRGLVAVRSGNNNFVSWRWLGTESDNITFNLYRNGTRVNNTPLTITNYTDNGAANSATYYVRAIVNGQEQTPSETVNVWGQQYLTLPLQRPAGGTNQSGDYTYSPNDCSVGDVDGDGVYEIFVKWEPSNAKDNSQSGYTGNVFIDCYKLDGTRLWRIDLGRNIRAGAHYTQFMVYDFDGDGKAEMMCKTADATIDGTGVVIGNINADHRNGNGYILAGPEYLTVFNGETGRAMATTNYIPSRHPSTQNPTSAQLNSVWGDGYGNRVDRFLAGVAYLDGQRPSAVFCRGYYTRTVLVAWDWRNGQLTQRWIFDTNASDIPNEYRGQGAHSLSIADVDNDGFDEIVYGAMVVDHNGRPKHNTNWLHGDALHVSNMCPDRDGQEIYMPHESANGSTRPGVSLRDANTGNAIWTKPHTGDVGRGMAADIDPRHKGYEFWGSNGFGLYNCAGETIGNVPGSINFGIWWDGDLLRELLDRNRIDKWNHTNNSLNRILTATGAGSINGTKANPCLSGDLFGDWREEVIFKTDDNQALRIYTTTNPTTHRIRTLMHDPQYRVAIAWQNVSYNQPPHPSFYLGMDMDAPVAPDIVLVGGNQNTDCNGTVNGTAQLDACGVCAGGATGRTACTAMIPAVSACEYDGVFETINMGFIHSEYLNGENVNGSEVLWTLNASTALTTQIGFRYANGSANNRTAQLWVNEQYISDLNFETTGAWTTWVIQSTNVSLIQGTNTVKLIAITDAGHPNFDLIALNSNQVSAGTCEKDCNNIYGGGAIIDNCEQCVGGTTGLIACQSDCAGNYGGSSYFDNCGICVLNTTQNCVASMPALNYCLLEGIEEMINVGFLSDAYVNGNNAQGVRINWPIYSTNNQTATIAVRYANGSTNNRPVEVLLNGQSVTASTDFPSTGAWTNWRSIDLNLNLNTGNNLLEFISLSAEGPANFDLFAWSTPGISSGTCNITSLNGGVESNKISCYPNPFDYSFELKAYGKFRYVIYDAKGVMMEEGSGIDVVTTGNQLETGIYMVRIETDTDIQTIKINKIK